MNFKNIPTGRLPYEIVEALPSKGEEFKVYGLKTGEDENGMPYIENEYFFYDGEYREVDLGASTFGFIFQIYKDEMEKTISALDERISVLESNAKVLFEDNDITLEEKGATIGIEIGISTNIEVTDGTQVSIELSDMSIDGEPIEDISGNIGLYELPDWDWQGGDLYSDVFGNGAYFSFGTKPMNAIASKVTLGFVNENGEFDVRHLNIGHIKVTMIESEVK